MNYKLAFGLFVLLFLIMTTLEVLWKDNYYKAVSNQNLMIKIMYAQDSLINQKQDSIKLLKHGQ